MMDRIWLQEYPEGVPSDIDANEFRSLKHLVEDCYDRFRDLPAFSNMGVELSYRDLDERSATLGAYLQTSLGLQRGDRVAIMLPNVLQYPVVLFGILRAGLVVVNVNPLYTARELEHQLKDSGARCIVVLENFCTTLQEVLPHLMLDHVIVSTFGDLFPWPKSALANFVVKKIKKLVKPWSIPGALAFRDVLRMGRKLSLQQIDLTHDDMAFLQYTGGTTGVSKGAILTHGNMVANVLQASSWLKPVTEEGNEVIITALPLYHIFALTANCLTYMKLGGKNVLITNPRDYPAFIKELGKTSFTGITGVNTLFNAMLNTPGFEDLDFSFLRVGLGGGMAVQKTVAERWKQVTGTPLIEAYGLTETSPAACINPMTNQGYNGSIGLPISSTWASIRDDDGHPLSMGEIGELWLKGPQVMRGYWQRPKETELVMVDGWLRTGDIARMDEKGYVTIEDRKKDMILVSGFNVYPNEVESVVMEHPSVLEVAAIGVPHDGSGEVVKLYVVRKGRDLDRQALLTFCRERLAAYKCPKAIEFREQLPKTNVGKILRRELRDENRESA